MKAVHGAAIPLEQQWDSELGKVFAGPLVERCTVVIDGFVPVRFIDEFRIEAVYTAAVAL
jgi:hypothetical protein